CVRLECYETSVGTQGPATTVGGRRCATGRDRDERSAYAAARRRADAGVAKKDFLCLVRIVRRHFVERLKSHKPTVAADDRNLTINAPRLTVGQGGNNVR